MPALQPRAASAPHNQPGTRPAPAITRAIHRATTGPIVLCIAALAAAGCAKPVITPNDERSQFDRYDAVRNQHAEQYVFDEFGRRKPNLRPRLLGKE